VREFRFKPNAIERQRPSSEPTFNEIRYAQEQTRMLREGGELRRPRLWKMAEFKLGDNVIRTVVPTKASVPAPVRFVECLKCRVWLPERDLLSHPCPTRPLDERDLRALANATRGRSTESRWRDAVDWDRL
jgi:hypothetical protein